MGEVLHKILDCAVKKIGDRQYEFTASTSDVDRVGEVIDVKGWDLKNFKKNPVILYGHDYHGLPIGRASKVWTSKDGFLKNVVEFPPTGTYEFADIVERLVNTGFLKTQSVGFIPTEWVDGDGDKSARRTYTKQELLEISIVPVPSNPNALMEAVSKGVISKDEMIRITKPEETENYFRVPVRECTITATMDVSKEKGIKGLYCGQDKKFATYLFSKESKFGWTMEKAEAWVKEHDEGKSIDSTSTTLTDAEVTFIDLSDIPIVDLTEMPEPKEVSQSEIVDELDYLIACIKDSGINEEAQGTFWNLVREGLRLSGNDIPVDIKEQIGLIYTNETIEKLESITESIGAAVSAVKSARKPKLVITEPEPPQITAEVIARMVKEAVRGEINKQLGAP